MKNKILKLLVVTMLAGSLLVGCGENETGTDTGADTTVNSEVDTNDDVAAKIDSGEYRENEYGYGFLNEEDIDKTYVDGTSLTTLTWEQVNMTIKIKESINVYNPDKSMIGFTKPNIDCTYIMTSAEWSFIAFGTEPATNDTYPNGAAYVRTDELKAVMEEIDGNNSSTIGEVDTNSRETEVTEEEMYAFAKEICDEAGLVYDESAFDGVNLEDIIDLKTSREYAHDVITIPLDMLDDKDYVKQSIVEYLKNGNCPAISTRDGYNGINYIIESVGIREPEYGEGSSEQYEFILYLKFY